MRNCTTSVIQVNNGIRMRVIPGARMLRMVTMKLTDAINEEAPRISRLNNQKSMLGEGENCRDVRLSYPNQPASGGVPARKLAFKNRPPARKIQNDSAFSRGKATSRAPIWSGTR